jgi:hypothetical protein
MQSLKTRIPNNKYKKIWKEKHVEENIIECKVTLYVKNKTCQCYIDSGFSNHTTRVKIKFLNLTKKEKGSLTFRDNVSARILKKGTITLENKKNKETNVILVENMKPNLLGVIQTCDQGHILIFD